MKKSIFLLLLIICCLSCKKKRLNSITIESIFVQAPVEREGVCFDQLCSEFFLVDMDVFVTDDSLFKNEVFVANNWSELGFDIPTNTDYTFQLYNSTGEIGREQNFFTGTLTYFDLRRMPDSLRLFPIDNSIGTVTLALTYNHE